MYGATGASIWRLRFNKTDVGGNLGVFFFLGLKSKILTKGRANVIMKVGELITDIYRLTFSLMKIT